MENEIKKLGPMLIGTFQRTDEGAINFVEDPNGKWRILVPEKKR